MRIILLSLLFILNPLCSFAQVTVTNAYARASHKMAKAGAAFMHIHNESAADDVLIAAASPVSERAELHTHSMDDKGVMRMREIEGGIRVPARGVAHLEPGGLHVMLLGLNKPLKHGSTFSLALIFASGQEVDILVEVVPLGARIVDTHEPDQDVDP